MLRRSFEPDHIDPDVVVVVDPVFGDEESVDVAVQDQGFAGAAFAVIYLAPFDGQIPDRCLIIAGVDTDAVDAADSMDPAALDVDVLQGPFSRIPRAPVVDAMGATRDLQPFHRDMGNVRQTDPGAVAGAHHCGLTAGRSYDGGGGRASRAVRAESDRAVGAAMDHDQGPRCRCGCFVHRRIR